MAIYSLKQTKEGIYTIVLERDKRGTALYTSVNGVGYLLNKRL